MSSFNKFNAFVANIANGGFNLGSDQLALALSDVSPVNTNSVIGNITQISYTNLSTRNITTISSVQSGGTYNLKLTNVTLSASGNVAQFRYVIIYDTVSGDLIGWYDYGGEINMITGDTFIVNFDGTNGLISIT